MSDALDQLLPPRPPVFDAFTGEQLDPDDLELLRKHLAAVDEFIEEMYAKHRSAFESRTRLLARIGELAPTDLPARRNQTDKQAKIDRCPRCRTRLPQVQMVDEGAAGNGAQGEPATGPSMGAPGSEHPAAKASGPEPEEHVVVDAPSVDAETVSDADGAASTGSEDLELLPRGQRTAEQEAALGIDILGAPLEAPPAGAGSTPSFPPPTDPIIVQAGEVEIRGLDEPNVTVAQAVADDPQRCLRYIATGTDVRLKAALVTYMHSTRPDLMKEGK